MELDGEFAAAHSGGLLECCGVCVYWRGEGGGAL